MNNFDLRKFLTENKLTTNSRLNEEDRSIEAQPVGERDTGVSLNLKKVKKMVEAEGYDVKILDRNLLGIKLIEVKIQYFDPIAIFKNGEMHSEAWSKNIGSEDEVLPSLEEYLDDMSAWAEI